MENNIINTTTIAVDDYFEEKADIDIVIPDYSPAASKILSCKVTPVLSGHSSEGERIVCSITCRVNIVYVDDDGAVRSVSKTETLTKTLVKKSEVDIYRIKNGIRPISVNCRLQNPRRITVRTVVGTALKVIGNRAIEAAAPCDGIEAIYDDLTLRAFCGSGDAVIHVNGSMPKVDGVCEIIETGGTVSFNDVRTLSSKAVVKGIADVYALVTTGDGSGELCFTECSIPFSDVIDIDGMQEGAECILNAVLTDIRCELSENDNSVSVEAEAFVTASAYCDTSVSVMRDAYSRSGAADITCEEVAFESLSGRECFSESVLCEFSPELYEVRILGIAADPVIKSISPQDGRLCVAGDMIMTVYMCNESEQKIAERSVPFTVYRDMPPSVGGFRCEASATARSVSFSMPDDNTARVTVGVDFELCFFETFRHRAVTRICANTDGAASANGILLYYAAAGERVWDIAKKYRTSAAIIERDNNLGSDTLEKNRMLLISYN